MEVVHKGHCCCSRIVLSSVVSFILGAGLSFIFFDWFLIPHGNYKPPLPGNSTSFGCTLEADVAILLAQGFGKNPTFLDQQAKCGRQSWGGADQTAACLEKATGISKYCGDCYGALTHCGATYCRGPCFSGPSEKCTKCICANCRANFQKCTKLPCTLLPHGKYDCGDCPGHI